ncbi:tetratricopeptide repeat protein [Microbacterium sp.]|uniref:tetratricopeptide repeat protein n=1 Tax=Microbacterium sp. TaxID=51671 RepID=UPI0039E64332
MDADPRVDALMHLQTRQYAKARELLQGALAQNPTDGDALILLAQTEASVGNLAEAERYARMATGDAGTATRAAAFAALSRVIGLDGTRAAEARDAATAAVQLEPEEWSHRAKLAAALTDLRDFPAAEAQAMAAIQLAPADPGERAQALVALSRVYLADPAQRQRGYRVMRDAAALDPTDPSLQQQVLTAQFTAGHRAEAIATALSSLRVMPTAVVPPLLARLSVYLLLRRVLGWLLLVAFVVPLLFFGIIGNLGGDSAALEQNPAVIVRAGAFVGLIGFALVLTGVLRPLADRSVSRAVWRFARRSALAWFDGILIALAVLSYLTGLAVPLLFVPAVPLPFLLMLVAWIVHGWGGLAFRVPSAATLLAQQNR